MLNIRKANSNDLEDLLALYLHLGNNPVPNIDSRVLAIWDQILSDKSHHILVGCVGGSIVSSCVLVVIPNLTRNQRPYALIENVVTHTDYRGRGYASQLLHYAKALCNEKNCYKIMLLTSSKEESTLNFYHNNGYNSIDKTAFIQWL